jgi:hypothetical protein
MQEVRAVKALFTDFEGVLHPSTAIRGLDMATISFGGGAQFAKHGLFRWASLLEEALSESSDDICVVVHSSWRKQPWASQRLVRDALGPLGHRFHGMTTVDLPRQASIEDVCRRAGISDYMILDDARAEFRPGTPNLVITNPLLGVSEPAMIKAITSWACPTRTRAPAFRAAPA